MTEEELWNSCLDFSNPALLLGMLYQDFRAAVHKNRVLQEKLDAYFEYYLAWEENADLCDRVGVTEAEYNANYDRLKAAEATIKELRDRG